jgi:hypothetical protein
MVNGCCRTRGRVTPGAPTDNTNALKHGRYTAEAITRRRELATIPRARRSLVEDIDDQN